MAVTDDVDNWVLTVENTTGSGLDSAGFTTTTDGGTSVTVTWAWAPEGNDDAWVGTVAKADVSTVDDDATGFSVDLDGTGNGVALGAALPSAGSDTGGDDDTSASGPTLAVTEEGDNWVLTVENANELDSGNFTTTTDDAASVTVSWINGEGDAASYWVGTVAKSVVTEADEDALKLVVDLDGEAAEIWPPISADLIA